MVGQGQWQPPVPRLQLLQLQLHPMQHTQVVNQWVPLAGSRGVWVPLPAQRVCQGMRCPWLWPPLVLDPVHGPWPSSLRQGLRGALLQLDRVDTGCPRQPMVTPCAVDSPALATLLVLVYLGGWA
jgi:hypothetical protein